MGDILCLPDLLTKSLFSLKNLFCGKKLQGKQNLEGESDLQQILETKFSCFAK